MISRLTKVQLIIFAIVTLLGGAFVGGRYAKIDRLVVDRSFPVVAEFSDSGGIFEGAQVTYRGIAVGRVGKLTFSGDDIKVRLDIENSAPKIPSDVEAVVANKSAVGEQFVDLRPRATSAPYLNGNSVIPVENTQIPLSTTALLVDFNNLVKSVDNNNLKIMVNELGAAFEGTGQDLTQIVETSTQFIDTATENLDVTRALIRDSKTVLQTQIDKQGQLQSFASDLALFSDTLADSDPDLRRLLDEGAVSAKVLRQVIAENSKDLTGLFNNLVTVNRPVYKYIDGVRMLFVLYPYTVDFAFTTTNKGPDGHYDVQFGLVTQSEPPPCKKGYPSVQRVPDDLNERAFQTTSDCTDPLLNPRGANKSQITETNRAPIAVYDSKTKTLTPTTADAKESSFELTDSLAAGKDSWKWLLLGPAASK